MADEQHDLLVVARLRDEISRGAANIRRELGALERSAERVGTGGTKGARGIDAMERSGARARRGLRDLNTGLVSVSRSLDSYFVSSVRRSATVIGLLTGGVAAFGLKAESGFQQSRIAFEALLGSEEKGLALFKQLQDINIKTPFELAEIAPATQLLLRYGVAADQVVPIMRSLLDAAALSGDPANNLQRLALATGQIISQGRLLGQDARQLAEAGINAYDLFAQKLGITQAAARKLGEEGKLSADIFLEGLINMEGPLAKLQGGAEKLSGTLSGQISNLRDALRVRLAESAGPAVDELTRLIVPITDLVGTAVDTVGPPVFQLVGTLTHGLMQVLPVAAPLLGTIVGGIDRLARAAGPALDGLAPLGDRVGAALVDMFTELEPVMPDLVDLFIAMVGILPDFIELLGDLILLATPLVRLATGMLQFEPVRDLMATLLVVLLGYSKLAGTAKFIATFTRALGVLGTTAETTGVKAGIAYGKVAALGGIAAGGIGVVAGLPGTVRGRNSLAEDLSFVGSSALLGASIGSIVPGIGTGVGAAGGALFGGTLAALGHIGDPVVPGGTMGRHLAAGGGAPGLQITSGLRAWGLRSSASGHLNGSAVDVVGPGLQGYVQRVRSQGGWAVIEGAGTGRMHAHAAFGDPPMAPRGPAGTWSEGGVTVPIYIGQVNGQVDFERGVHAAIRRAERDRHGRGYTPVWARPI